MSDGSRSTPPESVSAQTAAPAKAATDPVRGSFRLIRRWWRGIEEQVDQAAVIEKIRAESGWSPRYLFMTAMSAGIAILGLLLSSPAVVIGAMLLSPLMGPILGIGFSLAIGNSAWLKDATKALGYGVLVAILFCAAIVALSPLQAMTEEIAARTRPNLFDLGIALFSALAGAYAMIRGREGTIVGVAIATALMPPLAVVGYGLAVANWAVFGGALFLFFTNLMTIALSAAGMARLYGFRSYLSPQQSMAQTIIILLVFVALAVPLGFSLRQIAWETGAVRVATNVVGDEFDSAARVSQIDFDFEAEPIQLNATVLTPDIVEDAQDAVQRILSRRLGRPVEVSIMQYEVGTAGDGADAAEIALARMREQEAENQAAVAELGNRLALVAGVDSQAVTIDRSARRASVRAEPLPGAGLAAYYALEQRVSAVQPNWSIELVPPPVPLPSIAMADGEPAGGEAEDIEQAGWAGRRIGVPIGVGGAEEEALRVIAALRDTGARAVYVGDQDSTPGNVSLRWMPPDADRN